MRTQHLEPPSRYLGRGVPLDKKRAVIIRPPDTGRAYAMGPAHAVFKADGDETRGSYSVLRRQSRRPMMRVEDWFFDELVGSASSPEQQSAAREELARVFASQPRPRCKLGGAAAGRTRTRNEHDQ